MKPAAAGLRSGQTAGPPPCYAGSMMIPSNPARRPRIAAGAGAALRAALLFLLLQPNAATAASANRAPAREPVHPGLTRADFQAAKSAAGAGLSSATAAAAEGHNGELGDAAVTSDHYDVLRCDLDLTLDPAPRTIEGSVAMVLASRRDGLRDVVCDLRTSLTVAGVDHAGGPLSFAHAGDTLTITLPTELALGEVDSFVIRYGGQPLQPVVNRGLMYYQRAPDISQPEQRVPLVANMSQPAYAQSWWPCKDKPGDKFRVSMAVTVPDTLVAVSNGTLLGVEPAGAGQATWRWREDYPIASYLVSLAVTDYTLLEEECLTSGGTAVPLRHWVFPEHADEALVDFAPMCEMMDVCEQIYGPYPFAGEKYGHAEFIWPGAMEHQTVTSIGSGALQGDGSRAWLIVHELGHQWFGDSLTPREWADIWLNEGFATYTEALWSEHTGGVADYRTFMTNARNEAEWAAQGPVYDPVPVFPGRVIYDKGAWILHMLRGRLGDAPFFALVEEWGSGGGRPGETVSTAEFIALASTYAGEDLTSFFTPYLETTALPRVNAEFTIEDGNAGPGTRLRVSLSQHQTPLFDNVYPIAVTTTAGTETVTLRLDATLATSTFEFAAAVTGAVLDPDGWLLWTPLGVEVYGEGLQSAYPNPSAGDWVVFRYWLDAARSGTLTIYDVRGATVATRAVPEASAGLNEIGWDVRADDGARLPSGVYWAALELAGRRTVQKLVVVR
jgi:aminopeptidase N